MAHISDRWHKKDRTRTDRYGKGLRWQVEWADNTGAKRKKSFELRDLAEDFLTELRHEQKQGIYRRPNTRMTVRDVYTAWIESRPDAPANTIHAQRMDLHRWEHTIADRPVDQLTRKAIQDAVNGLLLDYAPNTVRNAATKLSTALRWGHAEGLTSTNPYQGIRLPRVPTTRVEPMTVAQVHALAQAGGGIYTTLTLFLASTGLRISEARAVTWDRIKRGTLHVDRQLDARGHDFTPVKTPASNRRLALGEATLHLLRTMRADIGEGEHRAVFHKDGAMLSENQPMYRWRVMREKTGLDFSGWHQLRHFHASQLIHAGFSPVAVASRLGHENATTTLSVYAHLWPSDDAAMAATADEALTPPAPSELA